jgi:acyl-CoA thioesterase I
MTPPPVNEDRTASVPAGQPAWRNEDLKKVARLVWEGAGKDPVVDLGKAFGDPANLELLLPDGLHPSLTGQKTIAAALVERLARV